MAQINQGNNLNPKLTTGAVPGAGVFPNKIDDIPDDVETTGAISDTIELNPEKTQGEEDAVDVLREALGLPVQGAEPEGAEPEVPVVEVGDEIDALDALGLNDPGGEPEDNLDSKFAEGIKKVCEQGNKIESRLRDLATGKIPGGDMFKEQMQIQLDFANLDIIKQAIDVVLKARSKIGKDLQKK